jgi:diguanylate cyclase (GGDEF)-like protein
MNLPSDLLKTLQSHHSIPSAPAVVMQILKLSQDPDIGTARIAEVISRDPALAAKILKVANSAWCGLQREVITVNQAVSLLGVNGAMSMALSFSLVQGLQKISGTFDSHYYWRRSIIAAIAALSISSFISTPNREELFVAGLLQDIGMLILNGAMPAYAALAQPAKRDHGILIEIERNKLKTDHSQVGSWLLNRWGLPEQLVAAVGHSHQPDKILEPLLNAVAVSSLIANIWTAQDTAKAAEAAAIAADNFLGISSEPFEQILIKIAADLPEATRDLDIQVGDDILFEEMLYKAREALVEFNLRTVQEARYFAIQAQQDKLTSVYNRYYLTEILRERFEHSRAAAKPLTILFTDIDNFKTINDAYGHSAGDAVLISVAKTIQATIREQDIVARFGGDEFIVLLADAGEKVGDEVAKRICYLVENQPIDVGDGIRIPVTLSVGWTVLTASSDVQSPSELLKIADQSLYAAKLGGRNRVARVS